jgi:hypothetical protein
LDIIPKLPEEDSLLGQADIGSHPLSFIRSFIEFVELKRPVSPEGKYYEGFDGRRKAFVVDVEMEKGEKPTQYIMTNETGFYDGQFTYV